MFKRPQRSLTVLLFSIALVSVFAACGDNAPGSPDGALESCTDGMMNGTETGIDCGGTCAPAQQCGDGMGCGGPADCTSGVCTGMICQAATCGDGITQDPEACDDGGTATGDGCDDACAIEAGFTCSGTPSTCVEICGDGLVVGTEACDDGGTATGDGCDGACAVEAGYACSGAPSVCGPVCGDTMIIAPETCDDGNTTPVDGCGANCLIEPAEIEPNEDGMTSTGGSGIAGNDFDAAGGIAVMNADTNGAADAAAGDTAFLAALSPAGDEDVFAVTNTTALPYSVRFDTWNGDVGFGFGVPCGTVIDTGLNIRDAAGLVLTSNDDRSGAADRCSGLTFILAPAQTVYAHVVEFGDNAAIASYGLQIRFTPIVCGDGTTTAPFEECDDGNTNDTDACSNACIAAANDEIDPNGTTADATASALQVTATTLIRGAISPIGDLDFYQVTVAADTLLRMETFVGAIGDCVPSTTLTVRLHDSGGTQILADTAGSGVAACGALVFFAPAGTYFVQVEESGNNAAVANYFLEIAFVGDEGTEAETAGTMGVNDTDATASPNLVATLQGAVFGDHALNTDIDVWSIMVPPGGRIRAEVIEGDRAIETCESLSVDSRLTLFDSGGVQLVDDDDAGRGFCSTIDGQGTSPLDPAARNDTAAAQVMFLHVRASTFSQTGPDGQFIYRLQVTIR